MDYELKKLLKETVSIKPLSSINAYNEPTFGSAVSVACRIQQKVMVIFDSEGKETVSHTQIFVNGDTVVTVDSQITLPAGTTPRILQITQSPDETGAAYFKCIYT